MVTTTSSEFLGGLIAFAREKQNISCHKLADGLEKDYTYHWKIEKGYKNITCEYIDRVIAYLNLTSHSFWALMPEYLAEQKLAATPSPEGKPQKTEKI